MKKINLNCYIDFMQCSTYGDKAVSSGNFVVKKEQCAISIDEIVEIDGWDATNKKLKFAQVYRKECK